MQPTDPWAFGLNQLLTVAGFLITLGIAAFGFQSFEKWKREKIEERRIDIALEALALAYEADFIFQSIRSPMSFEGEWAEMNGIDDPDKRLKAGPFFAIPKADRTSQGLFRARMEEAVPVHGDIRLRMVRTFL